MLKVRLLVLLAAFLSLGATWQTENFTVIGPTPEIARKTAEAAEESRSQLSTDWFGSDLPAWRSRCRVRVDVRARKPGGVTSYRFTGSRIDGLEISLHGPLDQLIDSVLPHEMTHAVFATKLGRPLPLWADEGVATLAEDGQQQMRQKLQTSGLIKSGRRLPVRRLLARNDSSFARSEMHAVYAQGHSLVDFLVQKEGKRQFVVFLDNVERGNWDAAVKQSYGFVGLDALEQDWLQWVTDGSPDLKPAGKESVVHSTP